MSHNKITVGGKTPDTAGEIAVDLNDLSDVSGSPSTGDALVYGGANWGPASPGVASTTLPYSTYVTDQSWSAGGFALLAGRYWIWRHLSGNPDMIGGPYYPSGFWIFSKTAQAGLTNTKWCQAYDIPAGVWLIDGSFNARHNGTTNYVDVRWRDASGNNYGNMIRSMEGRPNSTNVWALVDVASTTQIFLEVVSVSGSVFIPARDVSRSIAFQFIKIG